MSACFKLAEIAHAHTRFDLLAHTCKSPNKFHPASQVACSQKADRGQHPGCALPDRGDPDAPPCRAGPALANISSSASPVCFPLVLTASICEELPYLRRRYGFRYFVENNSFHVVTDFSPIKDMSNIG